MIKHICDRCGKELDATEGCNMRLSTRDNDYMSDIPNIWVRNELCEECTKELIKWLEEGNVRT